MKKLIIVIVFSSFFSSCTKKDKTIILTFCLKGERKIVVHPKLCQTKGNSVYFGVSKKMFDNLNLSELNRIEILNHMSNLKVMAQPVNLLNSNYPNSDCLYIVEDKGGSLVDHFIDSNGVYWFCIMENSKFPSRKSLSKIIENAEKNNCGDRSKSL